MEPKQTLARYTLVARLLVRKTVRDELQKREFLESPSLQWVEVKGCLESEFLVKGSIKSVRNFAAWAGSLERQLNESD